MLAAEEDLLELGLLERANHGARMANQVDVPSAVEVFLGALQDARVERIRRSFFDQDSIAEPLLKLAVGPPDRPRFLLPSRGDVRRLLGIAAASFHYGAEQSLQPEAFPATVGSAALGHVVVGQQFQLGRREQPRMAAKQDSEQSGSGARRRKDEHRGRILRLRCLERSERLDQRADLRHLGFVNSIGPALREVLAKTLTTP